MTICYFGIYKPDYSRNRVLIKGLKQNGVKIIECQSSLKGFKKYIDLIRKHKKIKNQYDIMIVGFPGYQAIILAKRLTRKMIIFDAFASLHDSMVLDRKIAEQKSLKAKYYWFLDWLSCKLASKILLDTNEHIKYFAENFKINKEKFIRVFVGSDDEAIKPTEEVKTESSFLVHFHGSNIPLQGVQYVIKAARLLEKENIKFNIIGSNIKQKYSDFKIANVNFIDNVPYEKLGEYMSVANVSLGIFGNTEKAARVIPNKVYEALACRSAVITGDSRAVKELLKNKENVLLCKMGSANDLADKILDLKNNKEMQKRIADNGYKLFKQKLTPKILMANLIKKF
ncbi:glycosyltransferase [Candidatus Parcubacteria bacterium]|nr:glycosyltransferase [Candidatus Parcubacteria bacterium]